MDVDWNAVRSEFPALENWTYLNTATFGQLPRRGVEAVAQHFAHRDELACWDFLTWYDDADRLRSKIARLIRCTPEDIAFVPNATTALGILLSGIDWRPGDQILTLEHEFPNNLYAPSMLRRSGVELVECPWERLCAAVNERTRLVAISSANYNTGFAPPLGDLAALLRSRGVLLYVDGTQSVGALEFDTARIQPDMLAVHAYKWMLAPNGAGFFYIRPEVREWLPPNAVGWRSHHDWRNVDNLHHGAPELTAAAEKYEGGAVSSALLYALEASVDFMLEIGPERIEQRVLGLAGKTRAILREHGATVEDFASPIVAARFEGRDVSQLARALKDQRVLVAARR
ncbi:MAG TPA: aminotransferase class V-fold PLP-dependent enzyme, partial [Bryobacteraceae bacterium]|nr:aminotransferase class V-fold PLP-dependent enzyme [Bryobacteraceae bacterium]